MIWGVAFNAVFANSLVLRSTGANISDNNNIYQNLPVFKKTDSTIYSYCLLQLLRLVDSISISLSASLVMQTPNLIIALSISKSLSSIEADQSSCNCTLCSLSTIFAPNFLIVWLSEIDYRLSLEFYFGRKNVLPPKIKLVPT